MTMAVRVSTAQNTMRGSDKAQQPEPAPLQLTSKDGTSLAVTVTGDGPPIVIVPGSLSMAGDWQAVTRVLAPELTTYVLNRCGRGSSGDHPSHSLEREIEDVTAVLEVAGPEAVLFGHSFGALVSLALAAQRSVRSLILYEPGLALDRPVGGPAVEGFSDLVANGDPAAALRFGLEHFVGLSPTEVEMFAQAASWSQLVAMAPTWSRELVAMDGYAVDLDRLSAIEIPTLMMAGEVSPSWLIKVSQTVHDALPRCSWATLAGQGHVANETAPDLLAREVASFVALLRSLARP